MGPLAHGGRNGNKIQLLMSFQCLKENIMCCFLLPHKGFTKMGIAFSESPIWQRPSSNGSISITHMTLIDVELKANDRFLLSQVQIGCFMCNDCNMTVLSQCPIWTPPLLKIAMQNYEERILGKLCVCYLWMCVRYVLLLSVMNAPNCDEQLYHSLGPIFYRARTMGSYYEWCSLRHLGERRK